MEKVISLDFKEDPNGIRIHLVAQLILEMKVLVQEGLPHREKLLKSLGAWRKLFQELRVMIIQYSQRFLRHPFCAMVKLKVDTMLIQKLNAKHFISALEMEMED